mmetsp:Transcript_3589/g.12427  ORF Transcript_3589/g.12427 Transcript_3589/m.12427 type:complete len:106 (-) Transcript_3589:24-341(-)
MPRASAKNCHSSPRRRAKQPDLLHRVRTLAKPSKGAPEPFDALAPYDSDDDPNVLVGRRVEVRWAGGTFYSGVISNFDDLGHHVCYDDGDSRVYSDILAKTFRLL